VTAPRAIVPDVDRTNAVTGGLHRVRTTHQDGPATGLPGAAAPPAHWSAGLLLGLPARGDTQPGPCHSPLDPPIFHTPPNGVHDPGLDEGHRYGLLVDDTGRRARATVRAMQVAAAVCALYLLAVVVSFALPAGPRRAQPGDGPLARPAATVQVAAAQTPAR